MSNRYYCLRLTSHGSSHSNTFLLRKKLPNLERIFKDSKFLGEDSILIFDFLTRLVEKAETLEMSKRQIMVLIPYLTRSACEKYLAAANESCSGNICSIAHWNEAVQHLLCTYDNEQAITEALNDFNDISQVENQKMTAYAARRNNTAYRCGNVHDEDDKNTLFKRFVTRTHDYSAEFQ